YLVSGSARSRLGRLLKQPLRPRAEPSKFTLHQQAGTGHLAVLSVAPWSEVRSDLQAQFKLSPAEALEQVDRTTAVTERKLLDMLKVIARVGTPQTSQSITRTASSSAGASREVTETEEPGEAPEFQPSLPGGRSAEALPGLDSFVEKPPTISTGAHTRYLLANALYQEVRLLSQYVERAAVRRGYHAHVVRMQVSLMPHVRTAPYDAYTTIGFFPADERARSEPTLASPTALSARQLPVVVPLLVTDDMESALAADSSEVVRQYALALSAMIQGFAVRSDIERYTDELVTTVTRDHNSVYQVARLGENSLRVRMGARLHSSGNFFMVPQTHNVTALVLTPNTWPEEAEVRVEARTEFRHAQSGEPLSARPRGATSDHLREQFSLFGVDVSKVTSKDVERLREAGSANDFAAFRACVKKFWPPDRKCDVDGRCGLVSADADAYTEQTVRRLWIALGGIATGGQYTSTLYTIPGEACPSLPTLCTVSGVESDQGFAVEVPGVRGLREADFAVRLRWSAGCSTDGESRPKQGDIAASVVSFDRLRGRLRCGFPPLANIESGGATWDGDKGTLSLLVETVGRDGCGSPASSRSYAVSWVRIRKPAPGDPVIAVGAPPAVKACGCAPPLPYAFTLKRTKATPSGAVTVRVRLTFTSRMDSDAVAGRVLEAHPTEGTLDVPIAAGEAEVVVQVRLDQLVDASRLEVAPTHL
ncbi:MAG TPA: hypothetical protein PK324_20660, partial [Nocardioides sp.]|nr:hypothetical protein [Nocardioides sp.]